MDGRSSPVWGGLPPVTFGYGKNTGETIMAKSQKLFPSMGPFVVVCLYGDDWIPHRGAKTEEQARKYRRELRQWPDDKVKVIPNVK